MGHPSGCTNRGATIRNVATPIDPISVGDRETALTCIKRTFAIACSAENAWGCAMEGQALRLGEGGPVDKTTARDRLDYACVLSGETEKSDSTLAPCRFAKQQLELLNNKE
ncbi:hypothetical protein FNJ84_14235 [Paracoccus sp. M683]|uniref:hypothetical protein n=1 Tax=Paracoccus sp. M683 TaxID=2594268 RepID=UPI001196E3B8|nr:hypothetical protein [Paracoccus sp. M683]TRW96000.1 hypothetical protein FNJ84_14235 [Paracoccus sp. M683]